MSEPQDAGGAFELFATALKALPLRDVGEFEAYMWKTTIEPRLKACGFLARFWPNMTGQLSADQLRVMRICETKCQGVGAIIVLAGNRGAGKTTICAEIAKKKAGDESLPPWERQPPYRKLVDLIAFYKPLYADFGSVATDTLMASRNALSKNKLLFIDEIHGCDDQKMKDRFLTDFLDQRYARNVDTILITNQRADEFNRATNDSILSRIKQHGGVIPCDWESFRK